MFLEEHWNSQVFVASSKLVDQKIKVISQQHLLTARWCMSHQVEEYRPGVVNQHDAFIFFLKRCKQAPVG